MFLFILATFLLGLVIVWYLHYFYYYRYLKTIPSPPVWPLIGNALDFKDPNKFVDDLDMWLKKYNSKSLRIHLPTYLLVMTKDVKIIEHLLSSTEMVDKGFEYAYFKNWLGISVLTSSGYEWRKKRKILTPTFHFKLLEEFHGAINSNGQDLVRKLKEFIDVESFNVHTLVSLCLLDIICETAMGTSVNLLQQDNKEYMQSIKKIAHIIPKRANNPIYSNDFLYQFTNLCRKEKHLIKLINEFHDNIIQNCKDKYSGHLEQQEDIKHDTCNKKRLPFLDLLLHTRVDGIPLPHQEIASEVATLILAANDTTSTMLSLALFLLSKHQQIQQKCFHELQKIFGDDKQRHCSSSDIQEMKYLECVIKETLRLYPAAPVITRRIKESFTIEGRTYPKGITIGIFIYGIHHDEVYYKEPEVFNPDRFHARSSEEQQPFTFIPFSAGPRNCLGQKFAWLELKILLSTILRNFIVKAAIPNCNIDLISDIVFRSANGIHIALEERK